MLETGWMKWLTTAFALVLWWHLAPYLIQNMYEYFSALEHITCSSALYATGADASTPESVLFGRHAPFGLFTRQVSFI